MKIADETRACAMQMMANACYIQKVCTTDTDFTVYRIHRNRSIPIIHPTME